MASDQNALVFQQKLKKITDLEKVEETTRFEKIHKTLQNAHKH